MPRTSVICYLNWITDYGVPDPLYEADFAPSAPLSNLATERPGQRAVWIGSGQAAFQYLLQDPVTNALVGRPVDVVAIVNCNLISYSGSGDAIVLTLTDINNVTAEFTPGAVDIGLTSATQNYVVWSIKESLATSWGVGFDQTQVAKLHFAPQSSGTTFGLLDAWTNTVTTGDPFFGTLVAGPVYRPEHGIKLVGFAPGTYDRSINTRSIGGSLWSAQNKRQKRLNAELTLVSETEVEYNPPLCGLRQLAEYCGISRPALVIPSDESPARIYSQAVYGCFDEPLSWNAVDKAEAETLQVPHFRCQFSVLESR